MDNDRNQETVIVENIVEDPIVVKYEDKSTTHNPQVSVDLLKMITQYVDFLGVEIFIFIIRPLLIDAANKLKVDENKFYATLYEEFKFQNWIKSLKHSNYLFIWSGRFQISTINSWNSLFQVEWSNVGHNLIFKFCNYLILVFLCNFFFNFRFRLFISFFLGAFSVVYSNLGFICFCSRLRVFSCPRFCFYYLNTLQPRKTKQFSGYYQ